MEPLDSAFSIQMQFKVIGQLTIPLVVYQVSKNVNVSRSDNDCIITTTNIHICKSTVRKKEHMASGEILEQQKADPQQAGKNSSSVSKYTRYTWMHHEGPVCNWF